MGRLGITAQEVNQAIHQLQSEPRSITVDNIREVLGTGSKSTIARLLREWKMSNSLPVKDPLAVPDELAAVVNGLWNQVQETAARDIATYQEAAQREVLAVQQQYREEQQQRKNLESQCFMLEATLSQLREDFQQLQHTHQQEQLEKHRLLERVATLASQISQQESENTKLHQLLQHMQQNLEHYQTAIQAQHDEQTALMEKQRQEAEHIRLNLQQQLNQALQHQVHLNARIEALHEQKNLLEQQVNEKQIQIQHLDQQHEQLQLAHHLLQHTHQLALQDQEQQTNLLHKNIKQLATLENQLVIMQQQLTSAEKLTTHLDSQQHVLREENLSLIQQKAHLEGQIVQLNQSLA